MLDTSECYVRGIRLVPLPGKLKQYIQSALFALKMNIYGLDTSELIIGGVHKLVFELENRPRTEAFRSHKKEDGLKELRLIHLKNHFILKKKKQIRWKKTRKVKDFY